MTPTIATQLRWPQNDAPDHVTAAALRREEAVLVSGDEIVVVRLEGATAVRTRTLPVSFAPSAVEVSPSGSFLVARNRARLQLWDSARAQPIIDIEAENPASSALSAVLGRVSDREILVCNPRPSELRAYDLSTFRPAFEGSCETFRIESLVCAGDGTHLAALGFFDGETKDSLSVFSLEDFAASPEDLLLRFRQKRPIADYAYRVAAGPCGKDALVHYRDPEDDEEGPAESVPSAWEELRGHRGFHIRRLDGALVARVPWDGPIRSFAPLAATAGWIAADCGGEIHLVAVSGTEAPPVKGRWLASSADGARIILVTQDGALRILELLEYSASLEAPRD